MCCVLQYILSLCRSLSPSPYLSLSLLLSLSLSLLHPLSVPLSAISVPSSAVRSPSWLQVVGFGGHLGSKLEGLSVIWLRSFLVIPNLPVVFSLLLKRSAKLGRDINIYIYIYMYGAVYTHIHIHIHAPMRQSKISKLFKPTQIFLKRIACT